MPVRLAILNLEKQEKNVLLNQILLKFNLKLFCEYSFNIQSAVISQQSLVAKCVNQGLILYFGAKSKKLIYPIATSKLKSSDIYN